MAKSRLLRKDMADAVRYGTVHLHLWRLVTKPLSQIATTHLMLLYRKDLTKPLGPAPTTLPVSMALATEEDIDAVAAINVDAPAQIDDFAGRLRAGHRCFVARHAGRIVGYNWTFVKPRRVAGRLFRLSPGEVYTSDAYTVPELRGQGIHLATNYAMLADAQRRGMRAAYGVAVLAHTSAWIAVARIDWEYQGAVLYLKAPWLRTKRSWCVSGSVEPLVDIYGNFRRRSRARLLSQLTLRPAAASTFPAPERKAKG